MQKIDEIVNFVTEAMQKRGLTSQTIQKERWSVYNPIINYHHKYGTDYYSDELLERLCREQKDRYEKGNISRKFYRSFVTAAFRIRSYVNTGQVDFSVVKETKLYDPGKKYEKLINAILESTGLKTKYQYKMSTTIRHFFCFIKERHNDINKICDKDILNFIPEAAKRNKNNMSVVIRALKYTAKYLTDNGLAEIKIDISVFRPATAPIHMITPYTQEEITAILNAINKNTSKSPKRDRAVILLAFNSGLRCVDIRNMKLRDINWKKQELHIVQKKTGKPISVPLNGKTLNAIADYILEERPKCNDDSIFIRVYPPYTAINSTSPMDAMVEKYCRLASVEKKSYRSFHSLRRSFGTELAEADIPVTSISQLLGHSNIESDKAYLSFNRKQTFLCSADFSEVPITKGVYADIELPSQYKLKKDGDKI